MKEMPDGMAEDETQAPEEADEGAEPAVESENDTEPAVESENDTELETELEEDDTELDTELEENNTESEDETTVEELVGLELTLLYPEGNRIGEGLEEYFAENLEQVGISLSLEQVPMQELLSQYYREEGERDCDMIYLGTNFDLLFDPSLTFRPDEEPEEETEEATEESVSEASEETAGESISETEAETLEESTSETEAAEESLLDEEETEEISHDEAEAGKEIPSRRVYHTTGFSGEELYALALELRHTRPGDALEYCRKWIAFQEEFARQEPMIPIYSNVYFDFYDRSLQNYRIADHVTWGEAIIGSRLGDPAEEEETEGLTEELTEKLTEEELQEGEILIDD